MLCSHNSGLCNFISSDDFSDTTNNDFHFDADETFVPAFNFDTDETYKNFICDTDKNFISLSISSGNELFCGTDKPFDADLFGEANAMPDSNLLCDTDNSFVPLSELNFNDWCIYAHISVIASGVPNYVCCRIPVRTSLHIAVWRDLLIDYHDNIVCEFLEYGWPMDCSLSQPEYSVFRNHKGARDFSDYLCVYLQQECAKGRMAGPFSCPPLTNFMVSPLNTVPKSDSLERRIIVDLSWPFGTSVNDCIPKDTYLGQPILLQFPTVDSICDLVSQVGGGAHIYKRDLRQAYRQFPIDPHDFNLLGYNWDRQFYFDTVLCMGQCNAAMACQRTTSCVSYIHSSRGHLCSNYLDDFIGVSPPHSSARAFSELGTLLASLGLDEKVSKACPPSSVQTVLGVEINTVNMTISVTPTRLSEVSHIIDTWLSKRSASKRELQSLIGKLVFISKCVRTSRLFIGRLLIQLRSLKSQRHRFRLNRDFKKDLLRWKNFLCVYNGVSLIPIHDWSDPDIIFSTDSCLTGCGGISHRFYFHRQFPDFITAMNLSISALELLSVTVALKLWVPSCRAYVCKCTVTMSVLSLLSILVVQRIFS